MRNLRLGKRADVPVLLRITNIRRNSFYSKIEIYGSAHGEIVKEFQEIENCKIIFLYFVNLFFGNANWTRFLKMVTNWIGFGLAWIFHLPINQGLAQIEYLFINLVIFLFYFAGSRYQLFKILCLIFIVEIIFEAETFQDIQAQFLFHFWHNFHRDNEKLRSSFCKIIQAIAFFSKCWLLLHSVAISMFRLLAF